MTQQAEGWLVTIHGAYDAGNQIVTALQDCTVTGTPAAPIVEPADLRH